MVSSISLLGRLYTNALKGFIFFVSQMGCTVYFFRRRALFVVGFSREAADLISVISLFLFQILL